MNEQERIATKIFSQYGLEYNTAKRAGGWTNAVWLNGDVALRLSYKKDSDRIRREVRLSEYLPNGVGYPRNIAVGITDGYEWSLSKRIYADNLSDVWHNLDFQKRTDVIRQILGITELLHEVDISKVERLSSRRAWYSSFNAQETYLYLEKYKEKKIFSEKQIGILYDTLERFWDKHDLTSHVLNHGDITMDNLLCFNVKIVSLMDFEHSVIAPPELDLHSIINLAFFSDEGDSLSDCDTLDYNRYKHDITKLLKSKFKNYSADLILGYAVLYRMRFVEMWFENPHGKLEELNGYIKLLSLANGEGGYLSELVRYL